MYCKFMAECIKRENYLVLGIQYTVTNCQSSIFSRSLLWKIQHIDFCYETSSFSCND